MINWLSPAINFPEEHAAIGALAVAIAYIFPPGRLGDPDRARRWIPRVIVGGFIVVVFLKELLWDPTQEIDQPFLWAGVQDFAFYLVGIGALLAALWARFRRL
jgi:hypothetical protein